jgi:hypothetical protein
LMWPSYHTNHNQQVAYQPQNQGYPHSSKENCMRPISTSHHFTSLGRTSSNSRCRGFTKSVPSLTVSSYTPYSILSMPLSFKIFCSPSSQVCRGLALGLFSCVLACQATMVYLSTPIVMTCLNHLNCANSIISEQSIIATWTMAQLF